MPLRATGSQRARCQPEMKAVKIRRDRDRAVPVHPSRPHLLQILVVVSFLHPLLQQGPQLTHVLETELQSLKTADSRLAEHLSWGGGLEEAK